MKYFFSSLFLLLLASLLCGCEKEVNLEHLRPAPKLVLNSVCYPDSFVKVHVSRTWFHTEDRPNVTLPDADVSLYVNGAFREKMQFQPELDNLNTVNCYLAGYRPAPGDQLRITASLPGFQPVEAETTVPPTDPVREMWVEVKKDTIFENGYYKIRRYETFHFTLEDDGRQENFYQLGCQRGVPQIAFTEEGDTLWYYLWVNVQPDYKADPVYDTHFSSLDQIFGYGWLATTYGRAFTNKLFYGKKYTLRLPAQYPQDIYFDSLPPDENDYYTPIEEYLPTRYRLCLYSLSGSYYKYLKTLQDKSEDTFSNELVDAGLAEPIHIYSNVRQGTGIVGAATGQNRDMLGNER